MMVLAPSAKMLAQAAIVLARDAALAPLVGALIDAPRQAAPGGKIAGGGELLAVADRGDDGVRGQRADPGNGREPAHRRMGTRGGHNPLLEDRDRDREPFDLLHEQPQGLEQGGTAASPAAISCNSVAKPRRPCAAMMPNSASSAHAVHQLCVLFNKQRA
jgi:hypothetical protein